MFDKRIPIEPGQLDRLVEIQQAVDGVGSSGMPMETWTRLGSAWMGRQSLRASERFAASQETAKFDTKWLMHYRADMDPDLVDVPKLRRLKFGGRVLDIVSAEHVGRKHGIELMTSASTRASVS